MSKYYLYILKCSDDSLYTGITTEINRRLEEHNRGKGAKYTASHRPVQLIYQKEFKGRSEASIEEARIKKLSRINKFLMIKRELLT